MCGPENRKEPYLTRCLVRTGDDDDDDDEGEVDGQQDVSARERRKRSVVNCGATHGSEERRKKGLRVSE